VTRTRDDCAYASPDKIAVFQEIRAHVRMKRPRSKLRRYKETAEKRRGYLCCATPAALFVAEGLHGVDGGGAACGNEAG
jgi:hypothetical protein